MHTLRSAFPAAVGAAAESQESQLPAVPASCRSLLLLTLPVSVPLFPLLLFSSMAHLFLGTTMCKTQNFSCSYISAEQGRKFPCLGLTSCAAANLCQLSLYPKSPCSLCGVNVQFHHIKARQKQQETQAGKCTGCSMNTAPFLCAVQENVQNPSPSKSCPLLKAPGEHSPSAVLTPDKGQRWL